MMYATMVRTAAVSSCCSIPARGAEGNEGDGDDGGPKLTGAEEIVQLGLELWGSCVAQCAARCAGPCGFYALTVSGLS